MGVTQGSPRRAAFAPTTLLAAGAAGLAGAGALGLPLAFDAAWPGALWTAACLVGAARVASRLAAPGPDGSPALLAELARISGGESPQLDAPGLAPEAREALAELLESMPRRDDRLRAIYERLRQLPEQIAALKRGVDGASTEIEESVEETASLLAHINSSIRGINSEVESLSRATEEASSSILEMQSSVDEVARSAGSLHDSVDSSTSSIHEISASIRQVAESTDSVQSMAEESAAAMVEMDRAIQEVSQHVSEASELTAQVSEGAEEGSEAVTATIDGIEKIKAQTLETRAVLERLASRIGEIGEIVNVIGSINDETNLLSLNAAIIAAQAGEQGKAFAVVANHVKVLAQRTASSTKEIETLIRAVQEESTNAVQAMGTGMETVETGVTRSRKAGESLEKIRHSAHDASARVSEIARATGEQSRNSKHVAEAAQRTSSMVQQITTAVNEQSRAADTMHKSAQSALELCRQVHRSTEEQRESSRFITASISSITEMIRSIQRNTESHGAASEAVAAAVDRILETAKRSGEHSREVVTSLEELRREADALAADPR